MAVYKFLRILKNEFKFKLADMSQKMAPQFKYSYFETIYFWWKLLRSIPLNFCYLFLAHGWSVHDDKSFKQPDLGLCFHLHTLAHNDKTFQG